VSVQLVQRNHLPMSLWTEGAVKTTGSNQIEAQCRWALATAELSHILRTTSSSLGWVDGDSFSEGDAGGDSVDGNFISLNSLRDSPFF
jgi:hypothetical protein